MCAHAYTYRHTHVHTHAAVATTAASYCMAPEGLTTWRAGSPSPGLKDSDGHEATACHVPELVPSGPEAAGMSEVTPQPSFRGAFTNPHRVSNAPPRETVPPTLKPPPSPRLRVGHWLHPSSWRAGLRWTPETPPHTHSMACPEGLVMSQAGLRGSWKSTPIGTADGAWPRALGQRMCAPLLHLQRGTGLRLKCLSRPK